MQKEALLSLKEHYDMDEVSGLSGFDRRMVSVPKFCSRECPKKGSCRYQQYLEHSKDDEMFIQICNHNYLLADGYHRLQDYRPLLKDYINHLPPGINPHNLFCNRCLFYLHPSRPLICPQLRSVSGRQSILIQTPLRPGPESLENQASLRLSCGHITLNFS